MEISNINHEDKDNDGNINIPLATSSMEHKMMEYIAAQTQAMAQTMVFFHVLRRKLVLRQQKLANITL
jgi:hypothetical protein